MSSIRVHVIVQLVVLAIRKVASVSPCCGAIGPRQAGTAAVWRQYSVAVGLPRHLQRACYIVSGPIVRTRRGRAARTNSCAHRSETDSDQSTAQHSYSSLTTVQRWASVAQPSFSGWHSDEAQRACVGAALSCCCRPALRDSIRSAPLYRTGRRGSGSGAQSAPHSCSMVSVQHCRYPMGSWLARTYADVARSV